MHIRIGKNIRLKLALVLGMLLPFFSNILCAQNYDSKAPSDKYGYSPQTTDSIGIYLDSAHTISARAPLRAIGLINRGIELSIIANDVSNEARAYLALGNLQLQLNQPSLASSNFKKSIQAFTRQSKSERLSYKSNNKSSTTSNPTLFNAYLKISQSLYAENKMDEALSNINLALGSDFSQIETSSKREATRLLARIQSKRGNISQALDILNNLLVSEKNENNTISQTETLLTIGQVYQEQGDDIKAQDSFALAKKMADQNKRSDQSINANSNLALLYRSQGNLNQEIEARNNNISINQQSNNTSAISKENLEIGNAYLNTDNVEMAEGYLQKSIDFSPQQSNSVVADNPASLQAPLAPIQYRSVELQIGADAYKRLAEGYLRKNDLNKAVEYFHRYSELQDSVQEARALELAEAIEISNGIGKNQQRIELLEKERELTDKSIEILKQDRNLKDQQLLNRNIIIGGLGFCILFMIVSAFIMIKNTMARRKTDKLLALQSLSGQMNPHFIFNALNSVNEFISQNDERAANRYLSSFSKLMRQVMDDSRHTFITLDEEIEMLRLYLQLEHARFKDQFSYTVSVSDDLKNSEFVIPPMIVQPYLENAIWHGLRYREGSGKLNIAFDSQGNQLIIKISDNGIGLKKSKELKTLNQKKQASLGLKNIQTRLALMNDIYKAEMKISMTENLIGEPNPGVLVEIVIPQKNIQQKQY